VKGNDNSREVRLRARFAGRYTAMAAPGAGAVDASGTAPVDVKRLDVWQKGMELCRAVYAATASFPGEERFGLSSQMRRAAISIPSNLAEGYGRASRGDYQRFVRMARGSAYELETQVLLASQLGFLRQDQVDDLLDRVQRVLRMLTGLARSLG
jgi:four helix bundle protein